MTSPQRKALKNATFRVPCTVWQRAKKRAVDEDRSLNDVIVKALEQYAGAETTGEPPLTEFLKLAAETAAKQKKTGPVVRSFTRDELHERGK